MMSFDVESWLIGKRNDERPGLIAAPMVRYSKLPFRKLVRLHSCELCYTPMIISSSFVTSKKARDVEFTTDSSDRPLIVQFAANNAEDMARAAEIVSPYCDGVDLNCGCPQRWAMAEKYGSYLISHPELIADMVRQTRARIERPEFSISVKIRVHNDLRKTVDLCQKAEKAGVSFVTVHARTPAQRREAVNEAIFGVISDACSVPVVANGDVKCLEDAMRLGKNYGVSGVMSATSLLHNPSLFAGSVTTTVDCVRDWVEICMETGVGFMLFHQQLIFMLDKCLTKGEKRIFNRLQCIPSVLDYLTERFGVTYDKRK